MKKEYHILTAVYTTNGLSLVTPLLSLVTPLGSLDTSRSGIVPPNTQHPTSNGDAGAGEKRSEWREALAKPPVCASGGFRVRSGHRPAAGWKTEMRHHDRPRPQIVKSRTRTRTMAAPSRRSVGCCVLDVGCWALVQTQTRKRPLIPRPGSARRRGSAGGRRGSSRESQSGRA
jgi:hypothetical protein